MQEKDCAGSSKSAIECSVLATLLEDCGELVKRKVIQPGGVCERRRGGGGFDLHITLTSRVELLTTGEVFILLVIHPHENLATGVQWIVLTFPIGRRLAKDGQDVGRAECERRGRLVEDRIKVDGVVFPAWAGEAI